MRRNLCIYTVPQPYPFCKMVCCTKRTISFYRKQKTYTVCTIPYWHLFTVLVYWICWGGFWAAVFLLLKCTKEMTLDCCSFRTFFTVKGHFCSFLLSNIIGYLAFLDWTFPLHIFFIFDFHVWNSFEKIMFFEDLSCLLLMFWSIFWSVDFSPDLNVFFQTVFSAFLLTLFSSYKLPLLIRRFSVLKESVFDSFGLIVIL